MRAKMLRILILVLFFNFSFFAGIIAYGSDEQRRPTVRVTTGMVQVNGWQNQLLKRNPSLSHWHWNPIYSYKQGLVGGGEKGAAIQGKHPSRQYPTAREYPAAHREASHYIKPVHVPFNPEAKATTEEHDTVAGKLHNQAVSGMVKPGAAKTKPGVAMPAAQYNGAYTVHDQSFGTQSLQSTTAVHGHLAEPVVHAALHAQPKSLSHSKK